MKPILVSIFLSTAAFAQSGNEKLGDLLQDRALYDAVARLKTDDRIAMFASLSGAKPDNPRYQTQMAATYLQKMRETMDPDYLNRASKIVDNVLAADRANYEALRLRSAIELERHDFPRAAENSRQLIRIAPEDPVELRHARRFPHGTRRVLRRRRCVPEDDATAPRHVELQSRRLLPLRCGRSQRRHRHHEARHR